MNSAYFTTPIFYVNAEPHLGHAYTSILADICARYHRQRGRPTRFLTGTDEHGEKVARSAGREGITPQQFVDRVSQKYREAWPTLLVAPDDFIRTTDERHKRFVSQILEKLFAAGEIYKGEYRGKYCVGCERFLTEKELRDGKCVDHNVEPQDTVEENYLFRMEKHRGWLKGELEQNPDLIQPERYRSEVLAMLREPIGDLSISRPRKRLSWGIPLPFDEGHVTYVWFDALINYMSALGGPGEPLFETYWRSAIHLIGKDILKPHGIFWPIMLKAAGLPLFKGLRVHGFWLVDASKMSKTIGNVVRPGPMVGRYGADSFRYFLARDMVFGSDADFSELALANRRNTDLANDLGNLLSRVLRLVERNFDGCIPEPCEAGRLEQGMIDAAGALPARFDELAEKFQWHAAVEEVLQFVRQGNRYFQESAPWALLKAPSTLRQAGTVLYHAAETLRLAAVLLYPVIPDKSVDLLEQLGCEHLEPNGGPEWTLAWGHLAAGEQMKPGDVLFPKIDVKALKKEFSGASEAPKPGKNKDDASKRRTSGQKKDDGTISIDQFRKVQFRVAEVLAAEPVPKTRKLLKLSLEVGDERRTVVSGIADQYSPEQLVGMKLILVWNLEPAKLRGIVSQGMILAAEDADGTLSLVTVEKDLASGSKVS